MAFMEHEVTFGDWIEVDGPCGTGFIPAELCGDVPEYHGDRQPIPDSLRDYCENRECWEIKKREGWGARLSAPGYMDCTEWSVFDSETEARSHLTEMYGDDDENSQEDR